MTVYMYQCYSLSSSHSPLAFPVSTSPFPTSVSLFPPCNHINQYHFSRLRIYASIQDTWFSLSDSHHSVQQMLGPFTSQHMTQSHSCLWLSNTPLHLNHIFTAIIFSQDGGLLVMLQLFREPSLKVHFRGTIIWSNSQRFPKLKTPLHYERKCLLLSRREIFPITIPLQRHSNSNKHGTDDDKTGESP